MLGRDVLHRMCLVEDHVGVGREEPRSSDPQRQITEEERMVADQDVGILHPASCRLIEALVMGGTSTAHAVPAVALHVIPYARPLQLRQCRKRAVSGPARPAFDLLERVPFWLVGQKPGLAFDRQPKPSLGEVVRSPLHQNGGELIWHQGSKQREVLLHQLLLQTDGVRADDDFLASVPEHARDRREEIGETLPGSSARFDEQAFPFQQGFLDRRRHLHLLWSRFETLESSSDRAIGSEHGASGKNHEGPPESVRPKYHSVFGAVAGPATPSRPTISSAVAASAPPLHADRASGPADSSRSRRSDLSRSDAPR